MVRILNTKYQNTDKYKVNPLHVNVGLGGDDLELETDKKGKTSVGPRQAVVQVSIFLPKTPGMFTVILLLILLLILKQYVLITLWIIPGRLDN